jgi:hypothetical protein
MTLQYFYMRIKIQVTIKINSKKTYCLGFTIVQNLFNWQNKVRVIKTSVIKVNNNFYFRIFNCRAVGKLHKFGLRGM